MRNKLLLLAFGFAMVAQPATAVTVVAPVPKATFLSGVFSVPTYTTATVFQNFNQSVDYNGALGTGKASDKNTKTGNSFVTGSPPNGSDLRLGMDTYTLNFNAAMQFFSFAASAPQRSTATFTFANGTSSQFVLGNIAGANGSGAAGLFVFDMLGQSGITSVALKGATGSFRVDDFAAAAPEPATWAMMIVGFGAVGAAMRRRKVSTNVAFA